MAKSPAWQRKEGKNPKGGLNAKGRASYNAANPGKPGLISNDNNNLEKERNSCIYISQKGNNNNPIKKLIRSLY